MGRHEGMGGHVESLVTLRPIAQMTEADYTQPKCQHCGKAIHDDRMFQGGLGGGEVHYCSKRCSQKAYKRRSGRVTGKGKRMRWAAVYDDARKANGAWISVTCDDAKQAASRQTAFSNKRGFESSRNGLVVSIRFMGVA